MAFEYTLKQFHLAQQEATSTVDAANTPDVLASAELVDAIQGQQIQLREDLESMNILAEPDSTSEQPSWFKKHYMKLALGALVVGSAVSIATNPLDKLEHEVMTAMPWALGGLATTEALWIGGAALMTASAGKKIGNPLKLHDRWDDISADIVNGIGFKIGLATNTLGALGTAGVVGVAATALPAETWPGAFGLVAADIASTAAIRGGVYAAMKKSKSEAAEVEKLSKAKVRHATIEDMDRLADIDLQLFEKAYGEALPEKQEIVDMLTKRFNNAPGWMFVAEMNGQVEGFVTAFRTNVPLEDFVSWEHSTADGTLDGKVDPDGKYGYVCNMTIKHDAVVSGAEDMLLANLFANGIESGLDYAYFVARMPRFKRWLEVQELRGTLDHDNSLQDNAEAYLETRTADGRRYDPQLRMYEGLGFELKRMVANGFDDDASMNYGVVFKADVPPSPALKKIKPVRHLVAGTLRTVAKNPKLLRKVF